MGTGPRDRQFSRTQEREHGRALGARLPADTQQNVVCHVLDTKKALAKAMHVHHNSPATEAGRQGWADAAVCRQHPATVHKRNLHVEFGCAANNGCRH